MTEMEKTLVLGKIHICQTILRLANHDSFNEADRLDMVREVCEKFIQANLKDIKDYLTDDYLEDLIHDAENKRNQNN